MSRDEILMGLMNLHDVFLNASVQRASMESCPLEDVESFHMTNRARFERVWVTFLYVLVEAWQSSPMATVREHVSKAVDCSELNRLIDELSAQSGLAKMRAVRDYMCHRDRREYWDTGRTALAGLLPKYLALHDAFDAMLLKALSQFTEAHDEDGPIPTGAA